MRRHTLARMRKIAKEVVLWILTALLVVVFANAGLRKFPESGGWTVMFRRAGFPDWFRIFIGVWETAAAIFIAIPRTSAYAAIAIIIVMIGAFGTNLMLGWNRGLSAPLISLAVAAIVLVARWRQRIPITPALRPGLQQ